MLQNNKTPLDSRIIKFGLIYSRLWFSALGSPSHLSLLQSWSKRPSSQTRSAMALSLHRTLSSLRRLPSLCHPLWSLNCGRIRRKLLLSLAEVDPLNSHPFHYFFYYLWMLQILKPWPQLTQVLLPISFSRRISSLKVMLRTPWMGNFSTYLSSWPLVLGKPSKITPFSDSGSFTFSLIIWTTISSLTNPPDLTIDLIV